MRDGEKNHVQMEKTKFFGHETRSRSMKQKHQEFF